MREVIVKCAHSVCGKEVVDTDVIANLDQVDAKPG